MQSPVNGMRLYGYLRHRSYLNGIANGHYEPLTRELYASGLKLGIVVVDGGVHIGLFSLLARQQLVTNCKSFAFEPDPYNFQAMLFNVKTNQGKNVLDIRKAISNSVNETCFYISSGTSSSSLEELFSRVNQSTRKRLA